MNTIIIMIVTIIKEFVQFVLFQSAAAQVLY